MKIYASLLSGLVLALSQVPAQAGDGDAAVFGTGSGGADTHLLLADGDDRQDRRQERGRSDERQDRRDCRQDEGRVGSDKRDCKQEEVRDGVRGKQGERVGGEDDKSESAPPAG